MHPSLEAAIAAHPSCERVPDGIFTRLRHVASDQEISIGFRSYDGPADALVAAFSARDFDALLALPAAIDADGRPRVTTLRLDVAHVPDAALVGLQPVRFEGGALVPAAPALLLEGDDARAWSPSLRSLDQYLPLS